jgi:hypothetical protein
MVSCFTPVEKIGIATIIISVIECVVIMAYNIFVGITALILYVAFNIWLAESERKYWETYYENPVPENGGQKPRT